MATDAACSNIASAMTSQGNGMPNSVDPLPPKFFTNLGCPSILTPVKAKAAKVHLVETAKDPAEGIVVKEQG